MQIDSKQLKSFLKYITGVKADQVTLDTANGRLSARDNEIEILVDSPALRASEPYEQHVLAVGTRRLSAITAKMSGAITLKPGERILGIESGRSKATLEVYKGKSSAPVRGIKDSVSLPLKTVLPILRFAALAAETSRAAQTGGVVELKVVEDGVSGTYQAAATDQHSLHVATAPAEHACGLLHIPLPVIQVLAGLSVDKVEITQNDSLLIFKAYLENLVVTIQAAKLVKQFPPYERLIPTTFSLVALLKDDEFKSALETVAPMVGPEASGREDGGAVLLTFSNGELTIKSYGLQNQAQDSLSYTPGAEGDDIFAERKPKEYSVQIDALRNFAAAAQTSITFKGNSTVEPVVLTAGAHTLMLAATVFGNQKAA